MTAEPQQGPPLDFAEMAGNIVSKPPQHDVTPRERTHLGRKIGIDIRAVQLSHGVRGIGQHILDLVEALTAVATEHEYLLIVYPHLRLPPAFESLPPRCRIAPLPASVSASDRSLAWISRIPGAWRFADIPQRLQASCLWRRDRQALELLARRESFDLRQECIVTFVTRATSSCGRCAPGETSFHG